MTPTSYDVRAAEAIAARDHTIPAEYLLPKSAYPLPSNVTTVLAASGFLRSLDMEIISWSATQLRDLIATSRYTAVQAVSAYIKSAAIAQQTTNCLVEMFADEALERAQWLDAELQRTGEVVGPLHGVPISVKVSATSCAEAYPTEDHVSVKDHDSPSGFLSLVGKSMGKEDAHLVRLLRESGAVLYVRILGSHGPMARSVDDLELYMTVILAGKPWLSDPTLSPRPWAPSSNAGRKLRIGVLYDDGVVKPVAPIRRALEASIEKLRTVDKFEIAEYKPFKSDEAWETISSLYWPDAGAVLDSHLQAAAEPMHPLTKWIISWSKGIQMSAEQQRTYTSYWNLANYPAAVLPTGLTVDVDLDREVVSNPRNEFEEYVYAMYDAAQSAGAPLSLQVIGYAYHDEQVIDALRQVDEVLRG
ncbi:hypothetical protein P7C73_g2225, partial [Tremellales sp. Uapishka_1]